LASFWLNLGSGLQGDQQLAAAARACRRAVALSPGTAEALSNAGTVAQELGSLDTAARHLKRALAVRPGDAVVWNNLANALTDITEVVARYRRAVRFNSNYREAHSNLLFALNYLPGFDCDALFREYEHWGARHAAAVYPGISSHRNSREPERAASHRLSVCGLSLESDRFQPDRPPRAARPSQFAAFCYAEVTRPDAMTERWRESADASASPLALATTRRRHDPLGRHRHSGLPRRTHGNNRVLICAHKPAPVQMSYATSARQG